MRLLFLAGAALVPLVAAAQSSLVRFSWDCRASSGIRVTNRGGQHHVFGTHPGVLHERQHFNDIGFWMFKEYYNVSIKQTLQIWTVMECIVAVVGLIGVLTLNAVM